MYGHLYCYLVLLSSACFMSLSWRDLSLLDTRVDQPIEYSEYRYVTTEFIVLIFSSFSFGRNESFFHHSMYRHNSHAAT